MKLRIGIERIGSGPRSMGRWGRWGGGGGENQAKV